MKTNLIKGAGLMMIGALSISAYGQTKKAPNVVFVFADQWRVQATGYNGDKNVETPNLDKLASESINVNNMVSCCPVCTPFRGSLLTGQYPLTTGLFHNDVSLNPKATTIGKVFKAAGYKTAYIGKWHVDGNDRSGFIPKERRQGFDYWKVLECTHNYNNSKYWDYDDKLKTWKGYDAYAQTDDAIKYIQSQKEPFIIMLSWGPPHDPFPTAPESQMRKYEHKKFDLRPNIPADEMKTAEKNLIGYYAHISALDSCIGALQNAIRKAGIEDNTIFVFTADHGEMMYSHGIVRKQVPFDESVRTPFLIKYPNLFGKKGKTTEMVMNSPDIMPTLLGMCNIPIPKTVEGDNKTPIFKGDVTDTTEGVLIASYIKFREQGPTPPPGREYRGVRTKRYTYVKDLNGPWLFFDNLNDPYQMKNLVDDPKFQTKKAELDKILMKLLKQTNDEFLPASVYVEKWKDMPYSQKNEVKENKGKNKVQK